MALLRGRLTTLTTTVALDVQGTTEWIHWNDVSGTAGSPQRKSGGGSRISDYTGIGGAVPASAAGASRTITWTGGTPTASGSDTVGIHSGTGVGGTGQGFSLTVGSIGTTPERIICNFSLYSGICRLHASLSDGSAAAIDVDTADTGAATEASANIIIDVAAGSAGQTLTITWTLTTNDGTGLAAVEAVSLLAAPDVEYLARSATSASTTSPVPAYSSPLALVANDCVLLVVGQKPSTANGGTVTTPSDYTFLDSKLAAGGYGATLGADTGNTNLYAYRKTTVTGSESGNPTITTATNDVAFGFLIQLRSINGLYDYATATAEDTSAGDVSLTFGAIDIQVGDVLIGLLCIPTDVTTPSQFTAEAFAGTGLTTTTAVEINEADSSTGNDIGGLACYATVTASSGSTAVTMTATSAGTTTNVRGPGVLVRVRKGAAAATPPAWSALSPVGHPDQRIRMAAQASALLFKGVATGGSPVTLALTGNSISSSIGTFALALQAALAGGSSTMSGGTPAPTVAVAAIGTALTSAAGTTTTSIASTLTGLSPTASGGLPVPATTLALSGQLQTVSSGVPTAGVSSTLAGQEPTASGGIFGPLLVTTSLAGLEATLQRGSSSPGVSSTLTGQSMTSDMGSTGLSISLGLSGLDMAGQQGLMSLSGIILAGQQISVLLGILSPSVTASLIGQQLASSGGTTTVSSSIGLSGLSSTIQPGLAGPAVGVNATGQSITTSQGSLALAISKTVSGQGVTAAGGSLSPGLARTLIGQVLTAAGGSTSSAVSIGLSGLGITGQQGMMALDGLVLDGQQVSVLQGVLFPTITTSVSGQSAAISGGVPSAGTSSTLVGASLPVALGSFAPSLFFSLTGLSQTVDGGLFSPALSKTLAGLSQATGLGSTSPAVSATLAGQSTTSQMGDMSIPSVLVLAGQQVSAFAGVLTPSISRSIVGQGVTSAAGSPSPAISITFAGLQAAIAGGEVVQTGGVTPLPPSLVQVHPSPKLDQAAVLLTKAVTSAQGIFQSDVLISTALRVAFADLRARPELLKAVFAGLTRDSLTRGTAGEQEQARAVEWFLQTDVPIVMDFRQAMNEGTCVTVELVSSDEAEATLGDVNYDSTEEVDTEWVPLTRPFDGRYDYDTGELEIPADALLDVELVPGMVLVDREGRFLPVSDVTGPRTIVLQGAAVDDFRGCVLRWPDARLAGPLESLRFKEVYRVGCHAHGDPVFLTYLHSIVVFCLLRYRELLLEARGFERSQVASGPLAADSSWGVERLWTRNINVSGYVEHSWPKAAQERSRQLLVEIDSSDLVADVDPEWVDPRGIFQSDLAVRGALVAGFADLRAHPDLLAACFATLPADTLSSDTYGDRERARAVEWFLQNDVQVLMDFRIERFEGTCVSIGLLNSEEAESTLGDVNYDPDEWIDSQWPSTPPFSASYDPSTGSVTVPSWVPDRIVPVVGAVLEDSSGRPHAVLSVEGPTEFTVQPGLVADFRRATMRYGGAELVQPMESTRVRETYRVGCHAHGDPVFLTYLHSIVVFCLLRYKQDLIEARGLERTTLSSGPFGADSAFGAENVWTRYVNITGYAQQSWPKPTYEPTRQVIVGDDPGLIFYDDPDGDIESDPSLEGWGIRTRR